MITEAEIDERLKPLRGKVPNFLIDDLRSRLVKKKEILTPEEVDKIVEKVLKTYSGQIERLSKLDRRVEEIGKYLEEIRNQIMSLTNQGMVQPNSSLSSVQEESQVAAGGTPPSSSEMPMSSTGPSDFSGGSPTSEAFGNASTEAAVASQPSSFIPQVQNPKEVTPMEKTIGSPEKGLEIPPDIKNLLLSPPKTRARLEHIPTDMVSTMMALKWLGFLIDRVGMQNLERVLEFYYQIGWISEDVLYTMLQYAEGIRPHHRDPDWRPDEKLTIQDHLVSLLFIERLRGVRITREVLNAIEWELKTINRLLEDIYGV